MINSDLIQLDKKYKNLSLSLKLNGEFDSRNAILGIKQGAGGVDHKTGLKSF